MVPQNTCNSQRNPKQQDKAEGITIQPLKHNIKPLESKQHGVSIKAHTEIYGAEQRTQKLAHEQSTDS